MTTKEKAQAANAEVKRAKKLLQLADARATYARNVAARKAAAAQAEADVAETVAVEFHKASPRRTRRVTEPAVPAVEAATQPDAQPAPKRSRRANPEVTA